jgi:hypothetical protein
VRDAGLLTVSTNRPGYDELVERHEREHRSAQAETRRDMLRTSVHILFWTLAGLALSGFALHTDDRDIGMVFWIGGRLVWVAGVGFSLLAAYRRGERRGDW